MTTGDEESAPIAVVVGQIGPFRPFQYIFKPQKLRSPLSRLLLGAFEASQDPETMPWDVPWPRAAKSGTCHRPLRPAAGDVATTVADLVFKTMVHVVNGGPRGCS